MATVARLVSLGSRWIVLTIIASLIGAPVEHRVEDFMGWDKPPVTIVRQLTPTQVDKLAQEILRQMEQRERDRRAHGHLDREHS